MGCTNTSNVNVVPTGRISLGKVFAVHAVGRCRALRGEAYLVSAFGYSVERRSTNQYVRPDWPGQTYADHGGHGRLEQTYWFVLLRSTEYPKDPRPHVCSRSLWSTSPAVSCPHILPIPFPTIYDQLGRHYSGKGHVIYTIKGSEI